jgi:hypothetical protein
MAQGLASRTPLTDAATPSLSLLERCTKPLLYLSVAAAISTATYGISVSWPALRWLVLPLFAGGWAAARVKPDLAHQTLLGAFYLVPGIFMTSVAFVPAGCWVVWMAPLFGAVIATTDIRRWSMPDLFKLPLACSALVVATTWPIILAREADFVWGRVNPNEVWWVATVAAATILGILWLDSLFTRFPPAAFPAAAYERTVALPMAVAWALSSLVAIYQLFGDVTFLNRGLWGYIHRARGTFADANPFGVLSAIWGPIIFAVAIERWSGWRRVVGAAALPLSCLAVWASGSRSSLPISAVTLTVIAGSYIRAGRSERLRRAAVVTAILVVTVALGWFASRGTGVDSPFRRVMSTFGPRLSLDWVTETAAKLEARDGYGTVSSAVIRDFPMVGVGIGSFHGLVPLYAWKVLHQPLVPDNAQNWLRHHLAEVGLVGSLGWMAWVAVCVWLLVVGRSTPSRPLTAAVLRGVLFAFGLISLVGMPGQDVAVVFTFWAIAFWFVGLLAPDSRSVLDRRIAGSWWIAVWAIVLGHTGATAYLARTAMRPPVRQAAADIDFSYGFYPPEPGATVRWAGKQAVDALRVPAGKQWLQVTVWVQHHDVPKNPVDVKVWVNREPIVETRLSSIEPVTRYVKLPDGAKRAVLDTWVSRTLRPRDFGVPDDRELGLLVDCTFLDAPP